MKPAFDIKFYSYHIDNKIKVRMQNKFEFSRKDYIVRAFSIRRQIRMEILKKSSKR
jgi:hypothetical protein